VSERTKRVAIFLLAAAAVAAFVLVGLLWLISRLGCEDAEEAALQTVACDSERGGGWRTVQSALLLVCLAAVVAGAALALRRARFTPLLLSAAGVVGAFLALVLINDIKLGDKPVPRLEEVRVVDQSCAVPCREGVRVSVTVDREAELTLGLGPARFRDIGSRQYSSNLVGDSDAIAEVDAGTHELRVTGEILNPPSQRGPLPPGDYEVDVTARPQDAGTQEDAEAGPVKRRVTITP
jgi:hypothetical protein